MCVRVWWVAGMVPLGWDYVLFRVERVMTWRKTISGVEKSCSIKILILLNFLILANRESKR